MNIRLFITLFFLMLSATAFGGDIDGKPQIVAVGRIRSLELRPKLSPQESACPEEHEKNGFETICVDNGCGWQVVRLHVDATLFGAKSDGDLVLHTYLGEWCKSELPLTSPMLVVLYHSYKDHDRFDWIEVSQTKSGEFFFIPDHGMDFAGVPLQKLIAPIEPAVPIDLGSKNELPKQRYDHLIDSKIGCLNGEEVVVCGGITIKSWLQAFLHSREAVKK